jgi:hypothetical protein
MEYPCGRRLLQFCPRSDFRVMSSTPWFPIAPTGKSPQTEAQALSSDDFRAAFKTAFQRELMRVFFAEVAALTGAGTLKDLLGRLGVNVANSVEMGTWYARARGERFPRPALIEQLRAQLPGMRLQMHHPMLRWLGLQMPDERSVRRFKARMPETCRQAINLLKSLHAHELEVSPALCERLELHRMTYLDALLVFACARNDTRLEPAKTKQLNRILWTLPILYPDDPLWAGSANEKRCLLVLIDHALGLRDADYLTDEWLGSAREDIIFDQLWFAQQRRNARPRALRSPLTRRRYWAKAWRWRGALAF